MTRYLTPRPATLASRAAHGSAHRRGSTIIGTLGDSTADCAGVSPGTLYVRISGSRNTA
jgi:hypothetical protein